jgi:hypothetical protein
MSALVANMIAACLVLTYFFVILKRKRPSSLTKTQLRAARDEAYLDEVLSLV